MINYNYFKKDTGHYTKLEGVCQEKNASFLNYFRGVAYLSHTITSPSFHQTQPCDMNPYDSITDNIPDTLPDPLTVP